MNIEAAIKIIKTAVKHTGTIDQKHIDLTLIPSENRPQIEKAMAQVQLAISEGKITRDEFFKLANLE